MMLRVLVRLRIDRVVIARVGMVDNGHRVIHQSRIERMEPMDARVTPEPSHLLAGEPFGLLRDVSERVIQIAQPVQVWCLLQAAGWSWLLMPKTAIPVMPALTAPPSAICSPAMYLP